MLSGDFVELPRVTGYCSVIRYESESAWRNLNMLYLYAMLKFVELEYSAFVVLCIVLRFEH